MTEKRKPITEPGPDESQINLPEPAMTIQDSAAPPQMPAADINPIAEHKAVIDAIPQKALKQANVSPGSASVFSGMASFANAQRMAQMLCASSLVPKEYQGPDGLPNAVIALEMAQRIGASPLAVMQNLYIVHGKPGWSAQFIIASLNSCGRYSPLRFGMGRDGEGLATACTASAVELATGELLEGPPITMEMAHAEGWSTKNGSKWKTMPELMLRYRAASFFGKLYAPDILMGMQSADELHDIIESVIDDGTSGVDDLNKAIKGK